MIRHAAAVLLAANIAWASVAGAAAGIIYVDISAPAGGDGTSWQSAFTDLHDALDAAEALGGEGVQIWVAAGEYVPSPGEAEEQEAFTLVGGTALYGGFAGWETRLDQRDWETNETILRREPFGMETMVGSAILLGDGLGEGSRLDGFTVRDGWNWPPPSGGGSGGLNLVDSVFEIANCAFIDNSSLGIGGGAMYAVNAVLTLVDCDFVGNHAGPLTSGGAINAQQSSVLISNCSFVQNEAGSGAALVLGGSDTDIEHCTFDDNKADFGGSAIHWGGGSLSLTDSVLEGNWGSPALYGSTPATLWIENTLVQQNSGGAFIWDAGDESVTITDSEFISNSTSVAPGGGVSIFGGEIHISNCLFQSNSTVFWGGGLSIFDSDFAIVADSVFKGNGTTMALPGGGLAAVGEGLVRVVNCHFEDNWTSGAGGAGVAVDEGASLEMISCRLTGNLPWAVDARWGGSATLINCLIDGNSAGGVRIGNEFGTPASGEIINCTIIDSIVQVPEWHTGVFVVPGSYAEVRNSILWNNGEGTEVEQISGSADVSHSIVQGLLPGGGYDGPGVIGDDPLFVDEDGRLSAGSPAIDAGNNEYVPPEIETDLDGNPRIVDGTGDGDAIVDMGAFEFQGPDEPPPDIPGDLTGDGTVGVDDLLILLAEWGLCPDCADCPADLTGDCAAGVDDLLILLANWG